jgi:hypothetical protein
MKDQSDSAVLGGSSVGLRPGPNDRHVMRLVVLALLLIAIGVVIGRVFRSVAKSAYRQEPCEVNLNLAQVESLKRGIA